MAESNEATNEFPVEDALKFLEGTSPFIMQNDMVPHVFSNEIYNPVPYGLLDIFYKMCFENRVGIVMAKYQPTGEIVPALAFIEERGNDDVAIFPVARIHTEAEAAQYLAPLGDGTYFEPAEEENDAAEPSE